MLRTRCLSYLGQRCCVNYYFKDLSHLLKKVLSPRSFLDVDVTDATLDIDGHSVIGVSDWIELTVHECLIQV